MSNCAFHFKNIPVHIVSDVSVNGADSDAPFGLRRCGVKFKALSHEHVALMRRFIAANTVAAI